MSNNSIGLHRLGQQPPRPGRFVRNFWRGTLGR